MKVLIKNLTANPIGLPPPFAGVLAGGGGTILDLGVGGPTVNQIAEAFSAILGGPNVVEFVEAPDGGPDGPLTPQTSAGLIGAALAAGTDAISFNGVQLKAVANPTAAQDVATKDYVDNTAGGTGTVTSVAVGAGLTTDVGMGGDPITSSGTISISTVPAANGGTNGDSSAATGIAHVTAGVWSYSAVDLATGDVTNTLPAANGGTGLVAPVTPGDNGKPLVASAGGYALASSLAVAKNSPELVAEFALTDAAAITVDATDGSMQDLNGEANAAIMITPDFTGLAAGISTSVAVRVTNDLMVPGALTVSFAAPVGGGTLKWIGTNPTPLALAAAGDQALFVLTNVGSDVMASGQALVV